MYQDSAAPVQCSCIRSDLLQRQEDPPSIVLNYSFRIFRFEFAICFQVLLPAFSPSSFSSWAPTSASRTNRLWKDAGCKRVLRLCTHFSLKSTFEDVQFVCVINGIDQTILTFEACLTTILEWPNCFV